MFSLAWIAPLVILLFLPETEKRELEDIAVDLVDSAQEFHPRCRFLSLSIVVQVG